MSDFLPVARPSISDAERSAVMSVLDSGWLTTGPRVREFEDRFAAFVGSRYAIAVNSATAALHLALEALGVGPGDEVIVPTWTFAASAEVIVHLGARPVLVDVDPVTLNATPDSVLAAITERTKAVVAVHFAGLPADIAAIAPLVPVVEDAAHAFPSRLPSGRMAGTNGRAGAFSFYATKPITTGEGGMLVTDDKGIAERARLMSLHGISRNAWTRYAEGGSSDYAIEAAGYKYNLTDLAAALGLAQLARADEMRARRRHLAQRYTAAFHASRIADRVELPADDPSHAWHLYVVRVVNRREAIARLAEMRIGTSVHFTPLHMHPYYRADWPAARFPVATREAGRVLSLPLFPDMTDADVDRVVEAMTAALDPLVPAWVEAFG